MRLFITSGLILATLTACGPSALSPETRANIERNRPVAPVTTADGSFDVAVTKSRVAALVEQNTNASPTIAQIESAAAEVSGCQSTAVQNLYADMNGEMNAPIPRSVRMKFGGQLVVLLDCA